MAPCPKPNRRGYTLVELIATLAVLAVLAALLVPALTGYVDKANEAAVIAEARPVLTAAQAVMTEAYARGDLAYDRTGNGYRFKDDTMPYAMAKAVCELAEVDVDRCEWRVYLPTAANSDFAAARIVQFTYCNKRYIVTYRAYATETDPAGWGPVERGETLPAIGKRDDPPFLESGDYKPNLPG